jgi:hypothetical protein
LPLLRFPVCPLLETVETGDPGVWDRCAIDRYAQALTVQIWAGETFLGSGIWWRSLPDDQGQILTNAHVVRWAEPPYRIVTVTGATSPAEFIGAGSEVRLNQGDLGGSSLDLALLQVPLPPPVLPTFPPSDPPWHPHGRTLTEPFPIFFSGWFPAETGGVQWQTTQARLVYHLPQPLRGGAHWAYTGQVEKGQSGGPVLDSWGHLLGLNTIHAHPLFSLSHFYEDGTQPDRSVQPLIDRYNWLIPSDRLLPIP